MREVTVCALPYFNVISLAVEFIMLILLFEATPFESRSFALEFSAILAMLSFPGFPPVYLVRASLDDPL